jgi:uncharacterized repeat protein (TIGR02543 family)
MKSKKWFILCLTFLLIIQPFYSVIGTSGKVLADGIYFAGGDGTRANPYQISNPQQLANIQLSSIPEHYILINDIDLQGIDWIPLINFRGIFDGKGHKIINLKIPDIVSNSSKGLFASTSSGAVIKNLIIENPHIIGGNIDIGALVGTAVETTFEKVGIQGGIIDTKFEVDMYNGHFFTMYGSNVGGLVGRAMENTTITNVYSTATVLGREATGGLIGELRDSTLTNGYAAAPKPTGVNLSGGLIGLKSGHAKIFNSYYDNELSGLTDSDKGEPKNTSVLKEQSAFIEWDFNNVWNFDSEINDGYPIFRFNEPEPLTYTVTYNGNGNTGGYVPDASSIYEQGTNVTVQENNANLKRAGFLFGGWNTEIDGSGLDYYPGQSLLIGNTNVTLYAKWLPISKYHVMYSGNGSTGGSVPIDSDSYEQNQDVTVYENSGVLVRSGYTFAGWNTQADGRGIDYTPGAVFSIVNSDVTLFAKWIANPTYKITYDSNGSTDGRVPDANSLEEGTTVEVKGNTGELAKPGFLFDGWNTEEDGSGLDYPADTTFTMGNGDITLYAKWKAQPPVSGEEGSPTPNPTPGPTPVPIPDSTPVPDPMPNPDPAPNPEPAPGNPNNPETPSVPSTGGSSGGGDTLNIEIITVDVDGKNGENLNKTPIKRTTESNGKIKDDVIMPQTIAKETVANAKKSGSDVARIIIPDLKDVVMETNVDVPKNSLDELKSAGLNLDIYTENATVSIPKASLTDFTEDLYFRFIPIKGEAEKQQVIGRARQEEIVKEALGDGTIKVVGRPMTIETNLQSRKVDLLMPLLGVSLPSNPKEREVYLNNLGIFIEHSDGDKELVRPEPVDYKDGLKGLKFTVEKFSTFTIVSMENLNQYFDSHNNTHKPYINGFKDGTFRPDKLVKRSELAAMLARNLPEDAVLATAAVYVDIRTGHWGYGEIMKAKQAGIMTGFSGDAFHSEEAVTRAQMATIAYRWMNKICEKENSAYNSCSSLASTIQTNYSDVKSSHWARGAINFMKEANVMEGYSDNTFRPEEKLTRAQAVKVLNRLFKRGPLNGDITDSFNDITRNHWAFNEVEEAARTHSYTVDESGDEYINN